MNLTKMMGNKKNLTLFAILLAVGIIFLALSEYSSNEQVNAGSEDFDATAYTLDLETRLCEIIGRMDGVSDVTVMITLKGGMEYEYAKEISKSLDGQNTSSETIFQMQEDTGGKKTPILMTTKTPEIKGVSVVCNGAENIRIRQKIIGLVSSTLNLKENQIYVTE